ncbi:MAG: hypothetical protein ACK5TP_08745, partial [bacterium]
ARFTPSGHILRSIWQTHPLPMVSNPLPGIGLKTHNNRQKPTTEKKPTFSLPFGQSSAIFTRTSC